MTLLEAEAILGQIFGNSGWKVRLTSISKGPRDPNLWHLYIWDSTSQEWRDHRCGAVGCPTYGDAVIAFAKIFNTEAEAAE